MAPDERFVTAAPTFRQAVPRRIGAGLAHHGVATHQECNTPGWKDDEALATVKGVVKPAPTVQLLGKH